MGGRRARGSVLRLAFEPIVMGAARRRVRTLILGFGAQLTRDEMVIVVVRMLLWLYERWN